MTDGMLFTGKTVEDAVADGLRSLGLAQDEVDIEVISRGSRGLFGIGSEPAQVRLTPRPVRPPVQAPTPRPAPERPPAPAPKPEPQPAGDEAIAAGSSAGATHEAAAVPAAVPDLIAQAPVAGAHSNDDAAGAADDATDVSDLADADDDSNVTDAELAALAVELLRETVRLMGFEAEVIASWEEPDADNDEPYLLLDLHGRDLGALIGRRGETLANLQYLLRLMVNQRLHQWKNIVVDVEQYRQHRAEHLAQLALRSADQVSQSGRPLSLEPMPPNERRIIHLTLRDHPNVFTESSGEGERRKIQILPRRS
jgi:spoIIIJ-associated protein